MRKPIIVPSVPGTTFVPFTFPTFSLTNLSCSLNLHLLYIKKGLVLGIPGFHCELISHTNYCNMICVVYLVYLVYRKAHDLYHLLGTDNLLIL